MVTRVELGFLVQGIVFLGWIVSGGILKNTSDNITCFFGFVIAGLFCFISGKLLNKKGKVLIDKETEEEIIVKTKYTFLFINVEYWGYILPIIGVGALFVL
ncbi:hypothetical protein [Orenia marismortui]|uniref:Uncharacterized protein n=1 Tax=Orenia marismortui TaxID=46469 RepID=A0A4R8GPT7_9FIRM|nr:hypothetical protein [Orenia marismortui]TDX44481.1 hypothetical protein C7959_1549 [Orenia marismortui]